MKYSAVATVLATDAEWGYRFYHFCSLPSY